MEARSRQEEKDVSFLTVTKTPQIFVAIFYGRAKTTLAAVEYRVEAGL